MKHFSLSFAFTLTFLLASCGEAPPEPDHRPLAKPSAPRVRIVPDPAMEKLKKQGPQDPGEPVAVTKSEVEPDEFTVDIEAERVFLPEKGWINAVDFWDIYYNRPQELPGNIDHEALQRLHRKRAGQ